MCLALLVAIYYESVIGMEFSLQKYRLPIRVRGAFWYCFFSISTTAPRLLGYGALMEKHTFWTSFFFFILMQNYQKIKTSLICPFSFYLEHIGFWKAINWKTISLNKNCIFNKFDSRMQHFWVKGYSDSMPEMMELIFGLFVASIFEKDTFGFTFKLRQLS